MKIGIRGALIATICAAIAFLVGLVLFARWRESAPASAALIEYSKLYLQAFKIIVISFFVAMIGVLLPALGREARSTFERLKESRIAYSEAKTGLNYLPIQLCSLRFVEAGLLLQQTHFRKHQAELYKKELANHLAPTGKTPQEWGDEAYYRLIGFRDVLEKQASKWDDLSLPDRLALLLESRRNLDQKFPAPSLAHDVAARQSAAT